jgi:hypothetical protein
MAKTRAPKGTPTRLNVWALGQVANGRRTFPNAFEATDAPHLRRCLAAGLLEVAADRTSLRLTDAGVVAVNANGSVPRVAE